ncbi:MAG: PKD domain-containing protein [Candidatus Marinimicrobia bacterium]|nr:PKD domain-containing protein [Candidatus Neomarinimicrobiota bacterium]
MKVKLGIIFLLVILLKNSLVSQIYIVKQKNDLCYIWIETEAGNINQPMLIHYNEKASGGQYIEVKEGNNNIINPPKDGRFTYRFRVNNAGTYKIWGRVKIDMDYEDAFWVRMDDSKWVLWDGIDVNCEWHWDEVHDYRNQKEVVTYYLEPGIHTLTLTYGMDQARIDKWFITNDMGFIPTGKGPGVDAVFQIDTEIPLVNKLIQFDGSYSSSTEGSIVSWTWDFGDNIRTSGKRVKHGFMKKGIYQVSLIVKDEKGLQSKVIKKIHVYDNEPVVQISILSDRPKPGETVTFDASGSFDPDGEIVRYYWDFGNGVVQEGSVVKYVYGKPGEYYVNLTVIDDKGLVVSRKKLMTVITGIPKKVILETDMCLDVDDVGALAMLHGLANNGEAEILAICYNEVHPSGPAAIDAINTWYGRGDIPIGVYKKKLPEPDHSAYLDSVAKFPHDLEWENAPSALEVYAKVLSAQPDHSVTIASVGFLNNLYELLKAKPDLVRKKVKELVIMGSRYGGGFNLERHGTKYMSEYVIRNWPSPIVFSELGTGMLTGEGLRNAPKENPVREAYYQFFYKHFCSRHSWDQIAVLYAVRGISDYFSELIDVERWGMPPGQRTYFRAKLSPESCAKIIEDLMLKPPASGK